MTSDDDMPKFGDIHLNDDDSYQVPRNYDLSQIIKVITNGDGFFLLKDVFSRQDVEKSKEIVDYCTHKKCIDTNTDANEYSKHNSYGGDKFGGLVYNLFYEDKIFARIAQHPTILEITRALLGPKSQLSSFASNTVLPGMGGQLPHLDYPYYDGFFPIIESDKQRPLLNLSFLIMLSKFGVENGATAFRPGSQMKPTYPHDREEFYRNMVQLKGEPGDVGILPASIQHCAMKNTGTEPRVAIICSFVPVYVKPYQTITLPEKYMEREASAELKTLLAYKHPYPYTWTSNSIKIWK